jgi:oligopeptide transport system substrate-binding protein
MFYGFNTTKPPFDNLLVRRAFALALDRQALAAVVNEWRGSEETIYFPATTMTPPHVLGHDLYGQVGLAHNPDRARALLAQAGYPNGVGLPAITLYSSDQEQHQLVARTAQAQWRDVLGVEVGLVFVPWGEYHDVVQTDPPQIWRMGWVTEYADPYSFLHDVFCSEAEAVGSERYQTLREAILDETDEAARRALYAEMSSLLCPSWQPTLMRWDNAAYTDLLTRAFHESDAGVRRARYVEAEGILCETDAVVIPLYWQ